MLAELSKWVFSNSGEVGNVYIVVWQI